MEEAMQMILQDYSFQGTSSSLPGCVGMQWDEVTYTGKPWEGSWV